MIHESTTIDAYLIVIIKRSYTYYWDTPSHPYNIIVITLRDAAPAGTIKKLHLLYVTNRLLYLLNIIYHMLYALHEFRNGIIVGLYIRTL